MSKLMLFPGVDINATKLMQIPDDFEEHEVYRYVTALISDIQEQSPDCSWEDVEDRLQERGFLPVDYVMGPTLKCRG
jgi:hypothetical protein